jgi:hypothetical protein
MGVEMRFESAKPTTGARWPLRRTTGMSRISITAEHNGRTVDITIEQDVTPPAEFLNRDLPDDYSPGQIAADRRSYETREVGFLVTAAQAAVKEALR